MVATAPKPFAPGDGVSALTLILLAIYSLLAVSRLSISSIHVAGRAASATGHHERQVLVPRMLLGPIDIM
ncbi:hypothetical protein CIK76_11480 [Glutamicibacter sp. BW80]|nr:hypothetical protein CIK76_11480 [Glutamicibacter sp. BW80]